MHTIFTTFFISLYFFNNRNSVGCKNVTDIFATKISICYKDLHSSYNFMVKQTLFNKFIT